ncbi:unnamed protein product [Acanthoscelides obtectus]|uniref:Uncharacterized protein n=1 Tax=Acanthoscelides obtectus TaxID=200917 RepID=A0A9P0LNT0_ACAOB|nr:unnamed protein product [Acanthoscelides obtectus]CAK1648255.1 hypothetical protein AOBTE_LOCUS15617 [Acanthoscelides obtectus]
MKNTHVDEKGFFLCRHWTGSTRRPMHCRCVGRQNCWKNRTCKAAYLK